MTYPETTDTQMLRLLEVRRGELIHDLRSCRRKETEIADELTTTENAIREIEGDSDESVLRKHDG